MIDTLPDPRRDLTLATTAWADRLWDEEAGLLWYAEGVGELHSVLHSILYAVGLLLRDGDGDRERAERAIATAIGHQFDAPGTVVHGTLKRYPEETDPLERAASSADPAEDPTMWIDYDPNWRQFTGTALALVRMHFGLSSDLEARIDRTIGLCVDGEPPDRVEPTYSNIALMRAWLEAWEGMRRGDEDLVWRADDLARQVHDLFVATGAFEEYNSPTYYGVDLYALGLWRRWGTPSMRTWGTEMEAALWEDIARFYHPGLRNLCGPYDRAYGMDMSSYAGLVGLWFWAGLGREHAPVPNLDSGFEHGHDIGWGPLAALVGTEIPDGADLTSFAGERLVERPLSNGRLATAWLDDEIMLGGMDAVRTRGGWEQYHPATVHWRRPDGRLGWIRLRPPGAADAAVTPGELSMTCAGAGSRDVVFEVEGLLGVDGHGWRLDGLHLEVEAEGEPTLTDREVRYPGPAPFEETTMSLRVRR